MTGTLRVTHRCSYCQRIAPPMSDRDTLRRALNAHASTHKDEPEMGVPWVAEFEEEWEPRSRFAATGTWAAYMADENG